MKVKRRSIKKRLVRANTGGIRRVILRSIGCIGQVILCNIAGIEKIDWTIQYSLSRCVTRVILCGIGSIGSMTRINLLVNKPVMEVRFGSLPRLIPTENETIKWKTLISIKDVTGVIFGRLPRIGGLIDTQVYTVNINAVNASRLYAIPRCLDHTNTTSPIKKNRTARCNVKTVASIHTFICNFSIPWKNRSRLNARPEVFGSERICSR